jgi:phosphoribosylformimino-5-aminoimidazole carboxamide ribotide isomerase
MGGRCVRLRQGKADERTDYGADPAQVAKGFEAAGVKRIHLIDLDGAFRGSPTNLAAIRAIRQAVDCEIELGGGMRAAATVDAAFSEGIDYVILGTAAVENPDLLRQLLDVHGERILVAIDALNGLVAVRGWVSTQADLQAPDFARRMIELGVRTFLHTDIARDGMLAGPNVEATRALAESIDATVIASGGISSIDDLQALAALDLPNLLGAVVGRALYDGRVDLAEALRALET